jgi:anaerobic magnesium-protoporphyrin IX monomethyl ester cyclase
VAEPGELTSDLRSSLGTRRVSPLPAARFPDAGAAVARLDGARRRDGTVDVLLVNPPAPDGGIWIRSQHRVGRRSRENMIWPQVDLAQMAAMLPDLKVAIVDCIATHMGWPEFEKFLAEKRPSIYVTQVTAPSLQNDMYGVFLARSLGARTVAFGTHVTPLTLETMRPYPALDFVFRGEPELTLRELAGTILEASEDHHATRLPDRLRSIAGLAWRDAGEIVINPDRPFIASLDDLPMPRHDLLPLDRQRMPMIKGPFSFISNQPRLPRRVQVLHQAR